MIHAKPDLRVFLEWMIAGSGSVITDAMSLKNMVDPFPRLTFAACLTLVLIGCDSNDELTSVADTKLVPTTSNSHSSDDSRIPEWRLVHSNEWYDLFELNLTDTEALICTAFHKTDAQLGIGIAFNIAILADDREFKYFTFKEASLTENQTRILEPLLPESRVLESHFLVEYSNAEPEDPDSHVFDAEFMTQLRRNQPDEFE